MHISGGNRPDEAVKNGENDKAVPWVFELANSKRPLLTSRVFTVRTNKHLVISKDLLNLFDGKPVFLTLATFPLSQLKPFTLMLASYTSVMYFVDTNVCKCD